MRGEVLLPGQPAQASVVTLDSHLQCCCEHVLPSKHIIKPIAVRKNAEGPYQPDGWGSCHVPDPLIHQVLLQSTGLAFCHLFVLRQELVVQLDVEFLAVDGDVEGQVHWVLLGPLLGFGWH